MVVSSSCSVTTSQYSWRAT